MRLSCVGGGRANAQCGKVMIGVHSILSFGELPAPVASRLTGTIDVGY
jgi:hypothetical protein